MIVRRTLGARAARRLETGALGDPVSRALSFVWASLARPSRPARIPPRARVIGIGGATLGGSYKTPLVLALARALAERGERVSVVGHGYRSASGFLDSTNRVVESGTLRAAGDDATWLARALAPAGVPVVVGPDRERALRVAGSLAPLVLVDGLLQTSETRLALSILALDAASPWGAGACPPAGDLRAPRPSLLAAADVVVRILSDADRDLELPSAPSLDVGARPLFDVRATLTGATPLGVPGPAAPCTSLATLRGLRVGVVLAIARPDRVLASLAAHGVTPVEIRVFCDHGTPRARPLGLGGTRVDAWLTTPKCAAKMATTARTYEGRRVLVLEQRLAVPPGLVEMVAGAAGPRAAPATARSELTRGGGVLPAFGEAEF